MNTHHYNLTDMTSYAGGIGIIPPGENQLSVQSAPNWEDYFGCPRGGVLPQNPYASHPRETLTLPEVYKGSNPYLTNVLITIIEEEELVPTRVLLPIRQTQNETTITWDEFHFNNTLLGPVPEEGVSRLVTQQVSERRDHYVRYGLAFMIEHGFMSSPKGQMTYQMNLRQIRNAILESLYIGVLESLLRCKTNSQVFQQCYGRALTRASARKALDLEVESWAEIQKTDYGWDMLNSRAHKTLKINGVTPDAWVVDDGVKKYVAGVRRENWAYFLKGPDGPKMYNEQLADGNPKSLDVASNALIFEAKSFNLPNSDDPVNVLSRRRTVGEYAISFPHIDVSNCKKYSSSFRDILVYDETRDGFKRLSLLDGISNCCRFDTEGGLNTHHTKDENEKGCDMFVSDDGKVLEYLGEMKREHLEMHAVRDWTRSAIMRLENEEQTAKDLVHLHKLVQKLESKPPTNSQVETGYFDFIRTAYTRVRGENGESLLDNNGMPIIPKKGSTLHITGGYSKFIATAGKQTDFLQYKDDGHEALFFPYGFASAAGIEALANPDLKDVFPTIHEEAINAKRGLDAIVSLVEAIMYDNLFARQSSAPFYCHNEDGHARTCAAVFANLLHEQRPPIIIPVGIQLPKVFPDIAQSWKDGVKKSPFETEHFKANVTFLLDPSFGENPEVSAQNVEKNDHADVIDVPFRVLSQALTGVDKGEMACLLKYLHQTIKGNQKEKEGSLRLVYGFIVNDLNKLTPYQIRWLIRTAVLASEFDELVPNNRMELLDADFKQALSEAQEAPPPAGTTVDPTFGYTQLTCSDALAGYLENHVTNLKSWSDHKTQVPRGDGYGQALDVFVFNDIGAMAGENGERFDQGFDGKNGQRFAGLLGKRSRDQTEAGDEKYMWKPSKTIKDSCEEVVCHFSTALEKVMSKALLGTPITRQSFERFVTSNVVFPFNIIYARPFMTYDMSTGICMKSGTVTGETLVGHADFQLGDNVVQKIHYGNFTFHSKSVVYRQQNVYLAEDMFATGYVGGNDTTFFKHSNDYKTYLSGGDNFASIFAMIAPYSSQEYANPMDISGSFRGPRAPLNTQNEYDESCAHFSTANFYQKYWNWQTDEFHSDEDSRFQCGSGTSNTMMFQGHQALYNPQSQLFDLVIKNTGHWGDRVYPGCGKMRSGMSKVLEPVYYNNIYGGGGNVQGLMK